jgi:hypothetical protein
MKQTDNARLNSKLELRRHFLRRYHARERPITVLECCQGRGVLWSHLAREFPVRLWGLDLKPRRGRLKVDSTRILAAGGYSETVIDIDTYGYPWKHWSALLQTLDHPATIFLTVGSSKLGCSEQTVHDVLGLSRLRPARGEPIRFPCGTGGAPVPISLIPRIYDSALAAFFHQPSRAGLAPIEIQEALPAGQNARYFGLRLDRPA